MNESNVFACKGSNHKILLAMLTIPQNKERADKVVKNLHKCGFPSPYIHYGRLFKKNSTEEEKVATASKGHRDILKKFVEYLDSREIQNNLVKESEICSTEESIHDTDFCSVQEIAKKSDPNIRKGDLSIMILEDDCKFTNYDAIDIISEKIEYLNANNKTWKTLNVGHCPGGPIWSVTEGLVYTIMPLLAHCYIINGKYVKWILKKVSEKKWKPFQAPEGFKQLSVWDKFAIFPSISTQTVPPRALTDIPIINHFSLESVTTLMEGLMVTIPIVIIVIVIILVILLIYWLTKGSK
jgi:hypothetical protein